MDNRIEGQYSVERAVKAANLALQCICMDPRSRPNMDEVIATLEQLQDSKANKKDHRINRVNRLSNGAAKSCRTAAEESRAAPAYPRPALFA